MQIVWLYLKKTLRFCLMLVRIILIALLFVCLVSHFILKDTIALWAVVYYSMPLPVLFSLALLLGLLFAVERRNRIALLCFGCSSLGLLMWTFESFSFNRRVATPDNVKIFCWNAASNPSADEVAHYVAGFDADLIGIVEAGIRTSRVQTWQNVFHDQHVEKLPGNMGLITKGKIVSTQTGSLNGLGRYNLIVVVINCVRFHVVLVDFDSDPFRSRAPAFTALRELIRAHAQENLIVMGDFNTPEDSVFFASFRPLLKHAFGEGGRGFAKTWPLPAPVLEIDHIWVSPKTPVVDCELAWSHLSDHRPVVANIALPREAARENSLH